MRALGEALDHSACLRNEENLVENFGPVSKVTIVKDPDIQDKDAANEKNRSMLAPKMLGLNTPEQDLHNLSEFGKQTLLFDSFFSERLTSK